MVGDLLAFAGAAAILAVLGCFVLALAGRGPIGREVARRAVAGRDELAGLATERGWWSSQGDDAAARGYDARLAAHRTEPLVCDLVIDGGAEGFVAESWAVQVRNLGSPVRIGSRQHFIRMPCPGVPTFLVRGMPSRHELRYFPTRFRDQAGFVQFHTQMLVAGDVAAVQDRLAPYVEAIGSSRAWVIGLDDHLVLMSGTDPSVKDFEFRVALGRAMIGVLT